MSGYYDEENKVIGKLSNNLDKNIELIEELFDKCDDIVKKRFVLDKKRHISFYILYIDGLTDSGMIERTIIKPLLWDNVDIDWIDVWHTIRDKEVETADIMEISTLDDLVVNVLSGNTVLLVEGYDKGIIISSKKLPVRGIENPDDEAGMRGSRDSFNESFRTSTALVRRRIRDPRLKIQQGKIGERSRSDYALVYMDDLVETGLVDEINKKINKYRIDGIFDSGMIEQLIEHKWYSPFPQIQATQRPDKVASSILEGRVAIIVDNSPEVLLLPATWNSFFQASDDYYTRWGIGTFARIIRYIAAFIAISLPGLYIAIACFHTEILPTNLVLSFAAARSGVPFPVLIEVLIMELEFELLREAGIRLPGQMGGTIGIVGGLIVGQAAVDASLVSTIVVIIVALTAIASFAIPNEEFVSTFRILKFFIIFMCAIWGLYGYLLGMLIMYIHLSKLESFGIPYMMPAVSGTVNQYNDEKDYIFKLPIWTMRNRPIYTKRNERKRMDKK